MSTEAGEFQLSRLVTGGNTTQFLYDGDALVAEYLTSSQYPSGTLYRRYVHGDQVDEPLIQYELTDLSTRRYLHADHQGSIIAHSTTTGSVTQKNAYDPYGIAAPTNEGRFGYTGQAWLKELGLNYYKARIYSPRLGRFLQTDPIFYKDDMNMYAYVGNDPLNEVDPTGMAGCPDMAAQGLSGQCLDSSNFRPTSRVNIQGQTTRPNNAFNKDAVGTTVTDATASNYAAATNQTTGNEQANRIDVAPGANGQPVATVAPIATSSATSSSASFPSSAITGAEGVVHTHPTRATLIVPGNSDWQVPSLGVPNYVAHGTRSLVVEISDGQVRVRIVSGTISSTERQLIQRQINRCQRQGVNH